MSSLVPGRFQSQRAQCLQRHHRTQLHPHTASHFSPWVSLSSSAQPLPFRSADRCGRRRLSHYASQPPRDLWEFSAAMAGGLAAQKWKTIAVLASHQNQRWGAHWAFNDPKNQRFMLLFFFMLWLFSFELSSISTVKTHEPLFFPPFISFSGIHDLH